MHEAAFHQKNAREYPESLNASRSERTGDAGTHGPLDHIAEYVNHAITPSISFVCEEGLAGGLVAPCLAHPAASTGAPAVAYDNENRFMLSDSIAHTPLVGNTARRITARSRATSGNEPDQRRP
jgi:hypothetical protein